MFILLVIKYYNKHYTYYNNIINVEINQYVS